MKTFEMPASSAQLEKAMRQAGRETIVLTRRGKAVAAVVPLEGADAETLSLSSSRKFLSILRRSFKQLDAGRSIPLAEMRRRVMTSKPRRPL
jgi:antitoxin (DNA-binding transcriptional repressor) of toxin-antitoxin stability system